MVQATAWDWRALQNPDHASYSRVFASKEAKEWPNDEFVNIYI